jgi:hypothetical protein
MFGISAAACVGVKVVTPRLHQPPLSHAALCTVLVQRKI